MRDILIIFIVLLLLLVIISVLGGTVRLEKFDDSTCVDEETCDKYDNTPAAFLAAQRPSIPSPLALPSVPSFPQPQKQNAATHNDQTLPHQATSGSAVEYFEPGSCSTVTYAPVSS